MDSSLSFEEIEIPVVDTILKGRFRILNAAKGLVIFSHGSGSSRMSTRNNYVADLLREAGFSSLLFDLLTEEEDVIYRNRFEIALLSDRLVQVTKWLSEKPGLRELPFGFFGSSTGAASAIKATVELGDLISTVVSRGGRPDLALEDLKKINCPTLLIVGGKDHDVIALNKMAYSKLKGVKQLEIIPGATHLFSEPGKLEEVAKITINWFNNYLIHK